MAEIGLDPTRAPGEEAARRRSEVAAVVSAWESAKEYVAFHERPPRDRLWRTTESQAPNSAQGCFFWTQLACELSLPYAAPGLQVESSSRGLAPL